MPHDNPSERLRIFRRDVIRERYRMPWWSLPLHGLWTAVVMNVFLWTIFAILFAVCGLVIVVFNGFDLRRASLIAFAESWGLPLAVIGGIWLIATVPMCVVAALINPRPRLILAGRGKLVVRYCRKRIVAPLSECQWKPGRMWSIDNVGSLWRRQPFLVLSWTPTLQPRKSPSASRTIFVGLTPSTYRQWLKLIVRENIPRKSWTVTFYVIGGIIAGGSIGAAYAAVLGYVARQAFGPIAAFGVMALCLIDGFVIGGITRYIAMGEFRHVRGYMSGLGGSATLVFASTFALAGARLFRGTGLLQIIVVAIVNGLVGYVFGRRLQTIYEKRFRDEDPANQLPVESSTERS